MEAWCGCGCGCGWVAGDIRLAHCEGAWCGYTCGRWMMEAWCRCGWVVSDVRLFIYYYYDHEYHQNISLPFLEVGPFTWSDTHFINTTNY